MEPIFADILLVTACFVAGWLGLTAKNRALTRDSADLDYRLTDLEGRVLRETRIRAGSKGQEAKQTDQALLEWAKEQTDAVVHPATPTLKPLHEWRRDKMIGPK